MAWTMHPWVPQTVKVTGQPSGVPWLSLSHSSVWKWFCFIPDPPGTGTPSTCRLALGNLGRTHRRAKRSCRSGLTPSSPPPLHPLFYQAVAIQGQPTWHLPGTVMTGTRNSSGRGCIPAAADLGQRCCCITRALMPPGHPWPRVGAASPSGSPYPWAVQQWVDDDRVLQHARE